MNVKLQRCTDITVKAKTRRIIFIVQLLIFLGFLSCKEKKEEKISKITTKEETVSKIIKKEEKKVRKIAVYDLDAIDYLSLEDFNRLNPPPEPTKSGTYKSDIENFLVPVFTDGNDFPLKKELDAYRELKSKEFAITGQKVTPAIKENWVKLFYINFDYSDKVIYVLNDNYNLVSVDRYIVSVGNTPYGTDVYGYSYRIIIEETVIGTINKNVMEYSKELSSFRLTYWYNITPDGPKIFTENGFLHYYILEKYVPLLQESHDEAPDSPATGKKGAIEDSVYLPVDTDGNDFPLKKELDAYRELKSREFAITGQNYTPAIKENWSKGYITFVDVSDKVIYVLRDNYDLVEIEKEIDKVVYTQNGDIYGDRYRIDIKETIIGTINENRIEYANEPSEFRILYLYFITPDGPKLASEYKYPQFYILEKDVPLLLESLEK